MKRIISAATNAWRTLDELYNPPKNVTLDTELSGHIARTSVGKTRLDLHDEVFGSYTGAQLAYAFAQIAKTVIELDLRANDLYRLNADALARGIAAIPPNVQILDLSNNGLARMRIADVERVFAAIPATVTGLILSHNDLSELSVETLARFMAAIPVSITYLDLSNTQLGLCRQLAPAFAALRAQIIALNLDSNFNVLPPRGLGAIREQAFAAIPKSVIYLSLRGIHSPIAHNPAMLQAYCAIPANVRHLFLDDMFKAGATSLVIREVFLSIPHTITSLSLQRNLLGTLSASVLAELLAVLPKSITSIDLSNNGASADWSQILAALQPTVTTVKLINNIKIMDFSLIPNTIKKIAIDQLSRHDQKQLEAQGWYLNFSNTEFARYGSFDKKELHKARKSFFKGLYIAFAAQKQQQLPEAIEKEIISYLTPRDAAALKLVCKRA